jgi:hypothetical protein
MNNEIVIAIVIVVILLLLAFLYGACRFALWFLFGWPRRKDEQAQPLFTSQSTVSYSAPSYSMPEQSMQPQPQPPTEPVRVVESDPMAQPTYVTNNYHYPEQQSAPPAQEMAQPTPPAYEPARYGDGYQPQQPAAQPVDYSNPEPRRQAEIPYYQPPVPQQGPVYYQPTYNTPVQQVYYQPTGQQPMSQQVPATPQQPFDFSAIPPYELPAIQQQAPIDFDPVSHYEEQEQLGYPWHTETGTPLTYDEQLWQGYTGPVLMEDEPLYLPDYSTPDNFPVADYPLMDAPFMAEEQEW